MPETYLSGGDTLQSVDNPNWQGQTFVIREDFILEFVDLQMRGAMILPDPVVQLFFAEITGEPWGDCLSRNIRITEKKSGTFTTGRVRFLMESYLLARPSRFVLIVSNFPPLGGNPASWQYDKGDATYPRGIRISSDDSGATWTPHNDDDFMFSIFGNPPLPKTEPPPPIDYFATLDMLYFHKPTSITFILSTSVPCHLWCYYTGIKPRRHRSARTIRGLIVPWGAYFCFSAYKKVEQIESGDTLIHTFEMPDWEYCQTKWFTFRGEVDNIQSPSVGPIFQHHHSGSTLPSLILRPDAQGDLWNATPIPWQPSEDHWMNINDVIPDEDSTLVRSGAYPRSCAPLDLYHLESPGYRLAPIHSIIQHGRFRLNDPLSTYKSAGLPIKTHGIVYHYTGCPFLVTTNWLDYQHTWVENPNTHNPWTWQEIEDLQIGLALYNPKRPVSPWLHAWTACTQTYLEVKYYA